MIFAQDFEIFNLEVSEIFGNFIISEQNLESPLATQNPSLHDPTATLDFTFLKDLT